MIYTQMTVSYADGKIYKLINPVNGTLYIGSTAQALLCSRMTSHRRDAARSTTPIYKAMSQIGIDQFKIVLVHAFPCQTKKELEAEEYKVLNAVIAAGTTVYNEMLNGKHSAAAKARIAAKKIAANLIGERSALFNYGSLQFHVGQWKFFYEDHALKKRVSRSFSARKYGYWGAKQRAEAVRQQVYPKWRKDPEEAELEALFALEI